MPVPTAYLDDEREVTTGSEVAEPSSRPMTTARAHCGA